MPFDEFKASSFYPGTESDKTLRQCGLHRLTWDDCRRYPNVESQLLADYGEVLTSPDVA